MEHISYGVTSDFDWYEIANIKDQLTTIAARLDRVLAAAKQREENLHQYILHLRQQNDALQAKINKLLDEQETRRN